MTKSECCVDIFDLEFSVQCDCYALLEVMCEIT